MNRGFPTYNVRQVTPKDLEEAVCMICGKRGHLECDPLQQQGPNDYVDWSIFEAIKKGYLSFVSDYDKCQKFADDLPPQADRPAEEQKKDKPRASRGDEENDIRNGRASLGTAAALFQIGINSNREQKIEQPAAESKDNLAQAPANTFQSLMIDDM